MFRPNGALYVLDYVLNVTPVLSSAQQGWILEKGRDQNATDVSHRSRFPQVAE